MVWILSNQFTLLKKRYRSSWSNPYTFAKQAKSYQVRKNQNPKRKIINKTNPTLSYVGNSQHPKSQKRIITLTAGQSLPRFSYRWGQKSNPQNDSRKNSRNVRCPNLVSRKRRFGVSGKLPGWWSELRLRRIWKRIKLWNVENWHLWENRRCMFPKQNYKAGIVRTTKRLRIVRRTKVRMGVLEINLQRQSVNKSWSNCKYHRMGGSAWWRKLLRSQQSSRFRRISFRAITIR